MELSELTPELFETAEFSERRRGYDIDQVERFLEETGTALAQLLSLYRKLEERATRAEAKAQELENQLRAQASAPPQNVVDEDDEIERATSTLVMARKTADATVAEAKGRAHTLVSEAEAKSDTLVVEARQKAEAEYATAKGRAIQEVAELESRREDLRAAVAEIESRMDGYRAQLRGVAASLDSLVDDPQALGIIAGSDEVGTLASDAGTPSTAQAVETAQPAEPAAASEETPETDDPVPAEDAGPEAEADSGNWTASGDPTGGAPTPGPASLDLPTEAVDQVDLAAAASAGSDWEDVEEGAFSLDSADVGSRGTDKYLRELESLDDPVGGDAASDEAMSAFFDAEQEPGRRFGWKR